MELFLQIGFTNAIVSAVLALIVLGLTFVVRNPFIVRGMWLVVLIKLIMPPLISVPLPISIPSNETPQEIRLPDRAVNDEPVDDGKRLDSSFHHADENLPGSAMPPVPGMPGNVVAASQDPTELLSEPTRKAPFWTNGVVSILATFWIASSMMWLGLFVIRIGRFHRMLNRSRVAPADVRLEASRIAKRFGIRTCPSIRFIDAAIPPLVWALPGRIQVVLPSKLMNQLGPQQISMILAHELMHVRRRDHWVRWIEVAILTLYWWNPVAWWVSRKLRDIEEVCCDVSVLQHFQDQNFVYGETLVRTVEYLSRLGKSSPVIASSFGKKNATQKRVEMILKNQLSRPVSVYFRRVLLLIAILILPFSASASTAINDPSGADLEEARESNKTNDGRAGAGVPQEDSDTAEKSSEVGKEIQKAVEELSASNGFSGVVLIELNGVVVANFGVGPRRDRNGATNNERTLFEVGSTTKPITALALLALEEQGKLSLDDSIEKFLPNVPDDCKSITIRHLMQHTSGIPGTNYGPHTNDPAEITPIYLTGGPQHEPGTHFEYWNQGYSLLSAIVAAAAEQDYTDAVRELVYEPAGMKRSCFTGDDASQISNVAVGLASRGQNRSALDPPYGGFYGLQYRGMGGAVCTASDLHQMINKLRTGELIKEESLDEMLSPGQGSYGLGWFVTNVSGDQRRVSHGGSVRGFLTAVDWYPDDECSMIILGNTDDREVFAQVESKVRSLFEAQFVKVPVRRQFSQEFIDSIVGQYTLGAREVTIDHDGKQLNIVIDWAGPKSYGVLEKGEGEVLKFVGPTPEDTVEVTTTSENGRIKSLIFFDQEYERKER